MTEIIVEDGSVNLSEEDGDCENGASEVNVQDAVVYGLPGVDVMAPLAFDSVGGNFSIAAGNANQNGYIVASDWNAFNGKQAAGNYITYLSGDVSASGPGSAAVTLASVNSDVGTFNNVTVNAKGLVTAASNQEYQQAYAAFAAEQILFGNNTTTPGQNPNLTWDSESQMLSVGSTGTLTGGSASFAAGKTQLNNDGSANFANDAFVISASGNISEINGVATSWPSGQGTAGSYLGNDGAGNLSWSGISASSILPGFTAEQILFGDGSSTPVSSGGFVVDTTLNRLGINIVPGDALTGGLHIQAIGSGAPGTAPIKIYGGTLLHGAEDGAIEYDGAHLWFTIGSGRYQVDRQTAKAITTATDTNYTILAQNTITILPTPSANRNLSLPFPYLYKGEEIIIMNRSTNTSYGWIFGSYIKDAAGNSLTSTTLINSTVYRLVCDGTIWIKTY